MRTMEGSIPIQFEPHFHTLTDSGRSHFLRPVDAIAEFIDNSIQACRNVEPIRLIKLRVFYDERDSFLMVADNGCGLSTKEIEEFATFSLDQKTRGNIPQEHDDSFISKFGVGSKQAGFFLGDRITLITKKKHDTSILKFVLDYQKFSQKYESKENVYNDVITSFPIVSSSQCRTRRFFKENEPESKSSPLLEEIQQHINQFHQQFAIFLIKLRPEIREKLRRKQEFSQPDPTSEIVRELADIYYFHLHPENQIDQLEQHFPQLSNSNKGNERRAKKKLLPFPLAPLQIEYSEYEKGKETIAKEIHRCTDNFLSLCVQQAKDIFPFELEIPDVENAKNGKFTVPGCIFYYPVVHGKDSIPSYRNSSTAANDPEPEALYFTQSNATEANTANQEMINPIITRPLFQVFWVNRLVPEAIVNEMKFFPLRDMIKIDNLVEKNWRQRIVGMLFLPRQFEYISNNKLKICLEPNQWIYHPDTMESYPRNAKAKFKDWMVRCYRQFDKEFIFVNRIEDEPKTHHARFSSLITAVRADAMTEISAGEKVKWKVKEMIWIGEIIDFEIHRSLPKVDKSYSGTGKFRYRRLPAETYGETIYEASLEVLDSTDYSPTKSDESLLERISDVKFYLFPNLGATGVELTNDSEVIANSPYHKIGIQILNNFGEPMNALPQMLKNNQRYSVELATNDDNVIGETADVTEYQEASQKDVLITKGLTSKDSLLKRSYYSFEKMTFQKTGKIELIATVKLPVKDGRKELFVKTITIHATTPTIHSLYLIDPEQLQEHVVTLGQSLPSFNIGFLDDHDQPVSFTGEVKVVIACSSEPKLSCKAARRPSSLGGGGGGGSSRPREESDDLLKIEDKQQIFVDGSLWIPNPNKSAPLFAKDEYLAEKVLEFKLNLIAPVDPADEEAKSKGKGKTAYRPISIEALTFTLRVRPGIPKALVLLSQERSLELKNNSVVELLTVGFIDSYGYRTSLEPLTDHYIRQSNGCLAIDSSDWQIAICEGPLSVIDAKTSTVSHNQKCQAFEIRNLLCLMTGLLPPEGKKVSQTLQLCCEKQSVNESIDQLVQPLVVPMKVFPSFTPARLCLYWNGRSIQDSDTLARLRPGQTVSGLTFDLVDSEGNGVDEDLYQEVISDTKSSWINCSWVNVAGPSSSSSSFKSKKKRYPPLPSQKELEDLSLPTRVQNEQELDFSVQVSFSGVLFQVHFSVVVEVTEGAAWQLVYDSSACEDNPKPSSSTSQSKGFLLFRKNDVNDLLKKIVGVCLVDRYDNCITSRSILSQASPPILRIYRLISISTEPTPENIDDVNSIAEITSTRSLLGEFPLLIGKITPAVGEVSETFYGSQGLSLSQMMDVEEDKLKEEEESDHDLWGFLLPKGEIKQKLHLKEAVGATLLLQVDSEDHYKPHEMSAKVIAGYPMSAAFVHPQCQQPTRSLAIELSRYSKLSNLRVLLFDTESLEDRILQGIHVTNGSYDYKPDLTGILNLQVQIIDTFTRKVVYEKKNLVSAEIVIPAFSLPSRDAEISSSTSSPVRPLRHQRRTVNSGRKRKHQSQDSQPRKRPKSNNEDFDVKEEEDEDIFTEKDRDHEDIYWSAESVPMVEDKDDRNEEMIQLECQVKYELAIGSRSNTCKSLPPLRLAVTVIRMNRVIGLSLIPYSSIQGTVSEQSDSLLFPLTQRSVVEPRQELLLELSSTHFQVKYKAGVLPDRLLLSTHTEDGQTYIPETDQFELEIVRTSHMPSTASSSTSRRSRKGHGKESSSTSTTSETLRAEKVFDLKPSPTKEGLILSPKEEFWSTHIAAEYRCTLVYHETRPTFVSSLPKELLSQTICLEIIVTPADIQELVFASDSLHALERPALMMNPSPEHRRIGQDITVSLVDQFDNRCSVKDSYELRCSIQLQREEDDDGRGGDSGDLQQKKKKPKRNRATTSLCLENGDEDEGGSIVAEWIPQQCSFYFSLLQLQYDPQYLSQPVGDHTPRYELCFALFDTNRSSSSNPVLRKKFPFELVSNTAILERKKVLEERLMPLLRDVETFNRIRDQLRSCNGSLEAQKGKLSNAILLTEDELSELEKLRDDRRTELNYMTSMATQIRPAKKQGFQAIDPAILRNISTYCGVLVDLAEIDDLADARIASWAAREVMDAAVVKTTEDGETLYHRGIPTMVLDQCPPFYFSDNNQRRRVRNQEEKSRGELPLPPILVTNDSHERFTPPGNPKYLKSIVFDNLKAALVYRQYLIRQQLPIMPIYTRQGEMISTRAFLNPRPNARCPANLDFIFGESNRLHHPEYQTLQQEIQLIDDRMELIEQRVQLVQQLGQFSHIEEMKRQIEDIQKELDELQDP